MSKSPRRSKVEPPRPQKPRVKKPPLRELSRWFETHKRVLPWRDEPTLYRVWVSEIMLQQTQVATVIPYFERFLERFPSVEILSAASEQEVLKYWAGLGYYSRARNLHHAARQIARTQNFPKTREAWLEVPGVGPYTAGAILSIALGKPEAILDGNVERVLSRVYRLGRGTSETAFKSALWGFSRAWVEKAHRQGISPSVLNQGLMELGATHCSVRTPVCTECPIMSACEAYKNGDPEKFPPRKKAKSWIKKTEELHCVWDKKGRVALRLREKGEWRAGLWDFVEQIPAKLRGTHLGTVETRHIVTRHKILRTTHVWKAEAGLPKGIRWVSPQKPDVPVGSAWVKTVQEILEKFPEGWK